MGTGIGGKLDVLDVGGGILQGSSPLQVPAKYWSWLLNWIPFATRLIQRGGISKYNTTACPQELYGALSFETSDGTHSLIVGGSSLLYRLTAGGGAAQLSALDPIASGTGLWRFVQFRNNWFAARMSGSALIRGTHDHHSNGGILAPTVAPTLTEGAAGDLVAGDYQAVRTYAIFDAEGNVIGESNPSPPGLVTIGANKKIDWSAMGASGQSIVNGQRLYRTELNGAGRYFWIADLIGSAFTSYTGDNVMAADLGVEASFDNGLPPAVVYDICQWRERIWVHNKRSVFYTAVGLGDAFSESLLRSEIPVFPNDGQDITVLHAFGDKLIVGKAQGGIHVITGYTPDTFNLETLTGKHGCPSPLSMRSSEGVLLWFGGDNFYRSDATDTKEIGQYEVRTLIDSIDPTLYPLISSEIYPYLSLYVVTIPAGTGLTDNNYVLIYNYKTSAWAPVQHASPALAPRFFQNAQDANGRLQTYAAFPGSNHLYLWNDLNTTFDDGVAPTLKWKRGGDNFGVVGYKVAVHRLHLQHTACPGLITLRAYRDGETVAFKTRGPIALGDEEDWNVYAFSTEGSGLASYIQTEGEIVPSRPDITIKFDGMALEYSVHGRRPVVR
jgi:hypothetical protein